LTAATEKVDEYYEKTINTPAYVLAMLLDPTAKMSFFKKQWPEHLHDDVLSCAESVVSHLPL
ncbi:hypothetical protein BDR07DRAFT_1232488, partial [Suillus spraguei]